MNNNSFIDNKIVRDLASLHLIPPPKRTEGDGIENCSVNNSSEASKYLAIKSPNLRDQLIYRPEDLKRSCTLPPVIHGKIVELSPKNIVLSKKESKPTLNAMSAREPKFVPYEPYKAAVKPIIPNGKIKTKKKVKIPDACLPEIKTDILEKSTKATIEYGSTPSSKTEWETERSVLENELQQLRRDNEQLENQLKFQVQVNGELKNLLVAAVGEDLETRVHILTEDKLQLARALLNSAQKLNTHQEQTEWLAGQCEVWRSRFLASSIMVEELARWKAALNQRSVDLQECMKSLLEERARVRDNLIATHRDLSVLCDNFDVTSLRSGFRRLSTSHVMDLSDTSKRLSAVLRLQLLGEKSNKCKEPDLTGFDSLTVPEHNAEHLLKHPLPLLGRDDPAYSAVMGAAVALGANHLFSTPAPACCSHCSGEVKTL